MQEWEPQERRHNGQPPAVAALLEKLVTWPLREEGRFRSFLTAISRDTWPAFYAAARRWLDRENHRIVQGMLKQPNTFRGVGEIVAADYLVREMQLRVLDELHERRKQRDVPDVQ